MVLSNYIKLNIKFVAKEISKRWGYIFKGVT